MARVMRALMIILFSLATLAACDSSGTTRMEAQPSEGGSCGITVLQYDAVLPPEAYQTLEMGSPVLLKPTSQCGSDLTFYWGVGVAKEDAVAEPFVGPQYMTEVTEAMRIWMVPFRGKTEVTDLATYVDLRPTTTSISENLLITLNPPGPYADQNLILQLVVGQASGEMTLISDYYDDVTGVDWEIVETEAPANVAFESELGPASISVPPGTLKAGMRYDITATAYRASGGVYPAPVRETRIRPW